MTGSCCVCTDRRVVEDNPLIFCAASGCEVAVHPKCYGVVAFPSGLWYCRKCESKERTAKVRCELCPSKLGAFKRTDTNGWAHVVCALYIPEGRFGNMITMEPIQVSLIPPERFSKTCYICVNNYGDNKKNYGAFMACYKSGCKQHFHVTCAQSLGLLCEDTNEQDTVKYFGYCAHHYSELHSKQRASSARTNDEASSSTRCHGIRDQVRETEAEKSGPSTLAVPEIFSLPDEMLLEIFNNLNHNEIKNARQVCYRWNAVLSNWNGFLDKTNYTIADSHQDSCRTFVKSEVPWKKLLIAELSKPSADATPGANWKSVPTHIKQKSNRDSVTSIVMRNTIYTWATIQKMLNRFPVLEQFYFTTTDSLKFEKNDGWYQTLEQVTKFRELQARLKVLHFNVVDVEDANFFLKIFTAAGGAGISSVLSELNIRVASKCTEHGFISFSTNLFRIIRSCKGALKTLDISIDFGRLKHVCSALRRVVAFDESTPDLTTFNLDWTSLHTDPDTDLYMPPSEEAALLRFLKSQDNLKSLSIPAVLQSTELVKSLPTSLVTLNMYVITEIRELLHKLSALKSIKLKSLTDGTALNLGFNNDVYPELTSWNTWGFEGYSGIPEISVAFPNLKHLVISAHTQAEGLYQIEDEELQIISENFVNLESLALDCARLTDFGISGIRELDCERLLKTRGVYMKRDLASLNVIRERLPLSSLKNLKRLSFDAKSTRISDVGIYFGLGFDDLRSINIVTGKRMSDWGLVELGTLNPNLNFLYVWTRSETVTRGAIDILKNSLPNIVESKFTVIIRSEVDNLPSSDSSSENDVSESSDPETEPEEVEEEEIWA